MEEQKLSAEQKSEQEQQILQGKRGHCLELATRIALQGQTTGEDVVKNAKMYFDFLQNG